MYQEQRVKSDKYLRAFKDILERNSMNFLSMEVSSEAKDTQEATDMIIKIEGGDVALRVREPSCKFRDFTIRSRSRYGKKTEIHKLKEGFGDWYLYGWGDGFSLVNEYVLIDLDKVRDFGLLDVERQEIPNGDGTKFINIPLGELQMFGCVVSKQYNPKTQAEVDRFIKSKMQLLSS